jgi:hypothetical protein
MPVIQCGVAREAHSAGEGRLPTLHRDSGQHFCYFFFHKIIHQIPILEPELKFKCLAYSNQARRHPIQILLH